MSVSRNERQHRIKFFALAVMASFNAVAQQKGNVEKTDAEPVATVEVNGSAEAARRDDVAARIVVRREEILKYGDQSLLDVMKRLPGVTVINSTVRMRGLGSGYTQILVNGDRAPAGFSLDTIAPEMIERIEVLRAATAEFSAQGIAGSVNIVMRRAVVKSSTESKLGIGSGAAARSGNASVSRSRKTDELSYVFGANLAYSESQNRAITSEQDYDAAANMHNSRTSAGVAKNTSTGINLNGRVVRPLGGGDNVTWQLFSNASRFRSDSDVETRTLRGERYPYPSLGAEGSGHNINGRSNVSWLIHVGDTGKLEVNIGVFIVDKRRLYDRFGYDETILVLDRSYDTITNNKGISWKGKYSRPLEKKHMLSFGWDAGHEKLREQEIQNDVGLLNSVPLDFDNSYDVITDRAALYLQDEWQVNPGYSVYIGARGERVTLRAGGEAVGVRSVAQVLSPTMQMLWKIPRGRQEQVRFAVSRTYKLPDLSRLVPRHFYSSFNSALSPDPTGNPALKPELASGIDLAYERYWKNDAMVSASVSARNIRNVIRNTVFLQGERWVSVPQNIGRATVRSLELEAKFSLKSLFEKAPAVQAKLSASRNWSNVSDVPGPGNRLDQQPRWSSTLGVDYRTGAWNSGASLSLASTGFTRSSATESSWISMTRDLDAFVAYKLDASQQMRFSVRNALRTGVKSLSYYTDQLSVYSRNAFNPGYLEWRLQYERKF